MKIKLPVFFTNDESDKEAIITDDINLSLCDIRYMVFYGINALCPYDENGKEYCTIHANGTTFICPKTVKEVEKLIDNKEFSICES